MANVVESIDLKETRVPILIPLTVTSIFAVAQLFLGSDPLIVCLSMAGILITFVPLHFNGRDIYSICAMMFGLRYLGVALIWKTFYRQPLQTNLFDPLASHIFVLVILIAYTSAIVLARCFDRGVTTLAFPNDPSGLRKLAIISFIIGIGSLIFVGSKTNDGHQGGAGGLLMITSAWEDFVILAFIAEACRNLAKSGGRNLFSPLLLGALVVTFLGVSALNARGFFLNCVTGVVLVAFIYRAIRWKYVVIGVLFIAFFTGFVTPVILYLRTSRQLPITQFVELSERTALRAATDPDFLKYIRAKTSEHDINADYVEFDYFGDESNVGNRLSYIALVDWIYAAARNQKPLGIASVRQSIEGVAPGFMGFIKRPESLGDWLCWQMGLIPPDTEPYQNFAPPMEGYVSWGWVGLVTYPLVLLFGFLFLFSKIQSYRLVTPVSIFTFSCIAHLIVEQTSDGYLNALTRTGIILFATLFFIHFFFFRTHAPRIDTSMAAAET